MFNRRDASTVHVPADAFRRSGSTSHPRLTLTLDILVSSALALGAMATPALGAPVATPQSDRFGSGSDRPPGFLLEAGPSEAELHARNATDASRTGPRTPESGSAAWRRRSIGDMPCPGLAAWERQGVPAALDCPLRGEKTVMARRGPAVRSTFGPLRRLHFRADRAVPVHPLPRRGRDFGTYASCALPVHGSGPQDAEPRGFSGICGDS